jgi:hypothetical protein
VGDWGSPSALGPDCRITDPGIPRHGIFTQPQILRAHESFRYQETLFIVIRKHRQFHVGVGGVTAPFSSRRRDLGNRAPRLSIAYG